MSRTEARLLSQRFDQSLRENSRRDFMCQVTMTGFFGAATVMVEHLLSQQSQDAGNQAKGQDVRFRGGSLHVVRGG